MANPKNISLHYAAGEPRNYAFEGGHAFGDSPFSDETFLLHAMHAGQKDPLHAKLEMKSYFGTPTVEIDIDSINVLFNKNEYQNSEEKTVFKEINHSYMNEKHRSYPSNVIVNQNRDKRIHGKIYG